MSQKTYRPKAVVILALRGDDPFLRRCLEGLLAQEYDHYAVRIVGDLPDSANTEPDTPRGWSCPPNFCALLALVKKGCPVNFPGSFGRYLRGCPACIPAGHYGGYAAISPSA